MIDLNALPLDKWTVDDLLGMYRERVAAVSPLQEDITVIVGELQQRCGEKIKGAFTAADKTHGKVTLKLDALGATEAGGELDAEVRQTVKWDQDKLKTAAEENPNDAPHIIEADLFVSENVYKALPPGKLKTALTAARTTKLSKPSLKIRIEN